MLYCHTEKINCAKKKRKEKIEREKKLTLLTIEEQHRTQCSIIFRHINFLQNIDIYQQIIVEIMLITFILFNAKHLTVKWIFFNNFKIGKIDGKKRKFYFVRAKKKVDDDDARQNTKKLKRQLGAGCQIRLTISKWRLYVA